MNIKNLLKWIQKNLNSLFCYFLIFIAILLFAVVIIRKPMKLVTTYTYNTGVNLELKDVTFPIEQDIKVDVENLNAITIYPGDDSLNKFQYQVKLTDEYGKQYFYHDYKNYNSNFMYLYFGTIPDSKNKTLRLTINCYECKNVKMMIGKSLNDATSLLGSSDDTLMISMNNDSRNNSFYWYSILAIVIALTLLPLARSEEKNEK